MSGGFGKPGELRDGGLAIVCPRAHTLPMKLKRVTAVILLVVVYAISVLGAYFNGRIGHAISPEEFIEIGTAWPSSSGFTEVIGQDGTRAYLVLHRSWGNKGSSEILFSTELEKLTGDARALITPRRRLFEEYDHQNKRFGP